MPSRPLGMSFQIVVPLAASARALFIRESRIQGVRRLYWGCKRIAKDRNGHVPRFSVSSDSA